MKQKNIFFLFYYDFSLAAGYVSMFIVVVELDCAVQVEYGLNKTARSLSLLLSEWRIETLPLLANKGGEG